MEVEFSVTDVDDWVDGFSVCVELEVFLSLTEVEELEEDSEVELEELEEDSEVELEELEEDSSLGEGG